jgi:hypothetical protein
MDRVFLCFYIFATVLSSIIFLAKMTSNYWLKTHETMLISLNGILSKQ